MFIKQVIHSDTTRLNIIDEYKDFFLQITELVLLIIISICMVRKNN
jgi:hypothetical protein